MAKENKLLFLTLVLILAVLLYTPQAAAEDSSIIVVPDDYPSIQEAVDNAGPGTKILVKSGTYSECSITVSGKTDIIIEGEPGARIECDNRESIFIITGSDGITIRGLTLYSSHTADQAIYIEDSSNIVVDSLVFEGYYTRLARIKEARGYVNFTNITAVDKGYDGFRIDNSYHAVITVKGLIMAVDDRVISGGGADTVILEDASITQRWSYNWVDITRVSDINHLIIRNISAEGEDINIYLSNVTETIVEDVNYVKSIDSYDSDRIILSKIYVDNIHISNFTDLIINDLVINKTLDAFYLRDFQVSINNVTFNSYGLSLFIWGYDVSRANITISNVKTLCLYKYSSDSPTLSITTKPTMNVTLENLDLKACGPPALSVSNARIVNLTLTGNGSTGLSLRNVTLVGARIDGSGGLRKAIWGYGDIMIIDSEIVGVGSAVYIGSSTIHYYGNITIVGSRIRAGYAVYAYRATVDVAIVGSEVSGGVFSGENTILSSLRLESTVVDARGGRLIYFQEMAAIGTLDFRDSRIEDTIGITFYGDKEIFCHAQVYSENATLDGKELILVVEGVEGPREYDASNYAMVLVSHSRNVVVEGFSPPSLLWYPLFICNSSGVEFRWAAFHNPPEGDRGAMILIYNSSGVVFEHSLFEDEVILEGESEDPVTIYLSMVYSEVFEHATHLTFNLYSPNPLTYEFNGEVYTSRLGNYWVSSSGKNECTKPDYDGDGICECTLSYYYGTRRDPYPLAYPPEYYTILDRHPSIGPVDARVAYYNSSTTELIIDIRVYNETACSQMTLWYQEPGETLLMTASAMPRILASIRLADRVPAPIPETPVLYLVCNPSNETIRLEASYTPPTTPTPPPTTTTTPTETTTTTTPPRTTTETTTTTTTAGEAAGYTSPPQAATGDQATTTQGAQGETTATLPARSGANTKLIAAAAALIIILAAVAALMLRR